MKAGFNLKANMLKFHIFWIRSICLLSACEKKQEKLIEETSVHRKADSTNQDSTEVVTAKPEAADDLTDLATEVVLALKNRDFAKISEYAHPEKGVRFSPYGHVNTSTDKVWKKEQLKKFWNDTVKHQWGYFDGSGDTMLLRTQDYYKKFIYPKDFIKAPHIAQDSILNSGNSLLNFKEVYPNAHFVEYYIPGADPRYGGMDWQDLRLFFEMYEGKMYLVGGCMISGRYEGRPEAVNKGSEARASRLWVD